MKTERIPTRFNSLIQLYKSDKGGVEVELLTPSAQFWNNLSNEDRTKVREFYKYCGEDLDEKLYHMKQMIPNGVKR